MSLDGFEGLRPSILLLLRQEKREQIIADVVKKIADEDIWSRRVWERWHEFQWAMNDPFVDWILNGRDDLTYEEWEEQNRPPARFHSRPIPPPNRLVR